MVIINNHGIGSTNPNCLNIVAATAGSLGNVII